MRSPPAPVVHPWMTESSAAAREAAGKLDVHADRLREAVTRARAALGDTDPAPETDPASAAVDPAATVLAALAAVQEALRRFADALDQHEPPLSRLVSERRQAKVSVGVAALDASIRERTDALSHADARCRSDLEGACRMVPTVAEVSDAGGWVSALLSSEVRDGLTRRGILDPMVLRRRCRAAVTADSLGSVRVELSGLPAQRIRALLARHPDLADRLATDPEPGPGEAEAGPGGSSQPWVAELWPSLVGPRDGADPSARVAANRRLLRAELARACLAGAALERPPPGSPATGGRFGQGGPRLALHALRRRLGDAWASSGLLAGLIMGGPAHPRLVCAGLRSRIRLYENLLTDRAAPAALAGQPPPSHPATPAPPQHRRVLAFDSTGRGRIAELCGVWPAQARVAAVFVPGTGTAASGFHQPAQVAAELARAVPGSAVVAWMGADFPQALASHAILARFALVAAPRLVRFVAGLGVPEGVPITLIGHSYGGTVVGAAERLGVRADRVVQVASPGAGPGVHGAADYAAVDAQGRPRVVARYELTAPGDPVRWARRRRLGLAWSPLGRAADLGVDPSRLDGVTILDAGVWERDVGRVGEPGWRRAGEPVRGPAGHAGVVHPAATAVRHLAAVVAGTYPEAGNRTRRTTG